MAGELINQLLGLLQNIKTDAANLHKDLDNKMKVKKPKGDLSRLFGSFGEMRELMSKLDESDIAQLKDEFKALMSGKEDLLEYNRDVNEILMNVKKRTEANAPAKDKVVEHLPPEQKDQNVGSHFDNWGSILNNVAHWIEQNTTTPTGSR